MRDEFLSEEDLDLKTMTDEELCAYWNAWLAQAQISNDADAHTYSHGVFLYEPQAADATPSGLPEPCTPQQTPSGLPDGESG